MFCFDSSLYMYIIYWFNDFQNVNIYWFIISRAVTIKYNNRFYLSITSVTMISDKDQKTSWLFHVNV